MTIRVPRPVVIAVGALLLVAAGLFIGLTLHRGVAANNTQAARLPCTRTAARQAVLQSRFYDDVLRTGAAGPGREFFTTYSLQLIGCRDLTDDGEPEMVVELSCCTAGAFFPWAIFTPRGSRWELAMDRLDTPEAQLKLSAEGVKEATPAWSPSDAMCCPSGKREGLVSYRDNHFVYQPNLGTKDRMVLVKVVPKSDAFALSEGSIAGFDLANGSLTQATEQFGAPTSIEQQNGSCTAKWRDVGLRIGFYNLTGKYACGRESRVSTASFEGHEAEQAGWRIDGMGIGMPLSEVQQRFPDARSAGLRLREALTNEGQLEGTPFILAERRAYGGRLPVLIARAAYGTIVGIDLEVGAAGE